MFRAYHVILPLHRNGNWVMNKPTQSELRNLVHAEMKKAPDVETPARMSEQRRKSNEESQIVLLRRRVWNSMLTAGLSSKYYQLLAKRRSRWELGWDVAAVVVLLAGLALSGAYPKAWASLLGGTVVSLLGALIGLLRSRALKREAQRWFEKWAELNHDTTELWEQIESAWPNIEQLDSKFATLRERQRGFTSTEYDCQDERLAAHAQRGLHYELELPPLTMDH